MTSFLFEEREWNGDDTLMRRLAAFEYFMFYYHCNLQC